MVGGPNGGMPVMIPGLGQGPTREQVEEAKANQEHAVDMQVRTQAASIAAQYLQNKESSDHGFLELSRKIAVFIKGE